MTQDAPQAGMHGPHHCIATAGTVTDLIFRYLRTRCSAQGGSLSLEDLDDAIERFHESVPAGFDLFETIHVRCMRASGSTVATLFTRDALLTTLLYECGYHSAQAAFAKQNAQFGPSWMRQFFHGLSSFIRDCCKEADRRVIAVYVQAAKKLKNRLSVADLLKEPDIQSALRGCTGPILADAPPASLIEALSNTINQHISSKRKVVGPDTSRVTLAELHRFLGLWRNELELTLKDPDCPQ
jgi:hypothetical protein